LRDLVIQSLVQVVIDPQAKHSVKVSAARVLGTVTEVAAFTERKETRVITSSATAGFAAVKVIPGSNLLVAADYVGSITCHTLDGKIVATLGQGDGITALGVNPEGTEIAVGRRDGSVARYAIP
jgi:hypothetical protein